MAKFSKRCRLHSLNHLPMWPRSGNIKLLGIDFPAVLLVKRNRGHACVAPEQTYFRVRNNRSLRAREQSAAEAAFLMRNIAAHPAKLPGRFILVRVQHEARAGNQRRVVRGRGRIKQPDVPGRHFVIARKLRGLRRQSSPQQPVPQANNNIDGHATNRDAFGVVVNQCFFHACVCTLSPRDDNQSKQKFTKEIQILVWSSQRAVAQD